MIQRNEVVLFVLGELQEATECEGLDSLVRVAQEVERALATFHLPTTLCEEFQGKVELDQVAHCLYPGDAPKDMVPLACKGEGNLLFDAASMLLLGNTTLSLELQVRTVVEMLLWKRYYLNGMIDSKVMLQAARFSLCTEESVEMLNLPMAVLEAIFDADVKASCFPGSFANMWHIYALASVLKCNIYSIYPMYNLKIRPYFNRLIRPRALPQYSSHMTLHIMWSGELESISVFKPHHFVALVQLSDLQKGSCNDEHQGLPLKTLELLNQDPQLSYSSLKDRYNITKSTFYRWKRQTQEHRKKAAARYEAKHFLQVCYTEGKLLPLHQFKEFFPDISRSTYYAWKHELQASGGCFSMTVNGEEVGSGESFEQNSWPSPEGSTKTRCDGFSGLVNQSGEKVGADRAQNLAFMQEAKRCLQNCIAVNTSFPYRNFKRSFPGISRSTYYNWRREAMQANPGFKDSLGSSEDGSDADPTQHDAQWTSTPRVKVCRQNHKSFQTCYLRKKKLRDEAKKRAQRSKMTFAKFKLKYPSVSSFSYWKWKKGLGHKKVAKEPVTSASDWSEVSNDPKVPSMESNALPFEKNVEHLNGHTLSPYNVTLSGYTFPEKHAEEQMFVMDVVALANFKAKAKLFLQQRFEEKSFPTFKEFRSYFPLTPRSTYYMWKRALHHGLPLVHG
ncbi:vertnin [Paramormyrops kingsleyae]|uniref:Vertnin n=1 Tax=Paramormyrops kingsleyae TaxID=1676925 RepID=A0A3B3R3C6_9TELE|nr:vertnin [Paramormyrops kingsleyae]